MKPTETSFLFNRNVEFFMDANMQMPWQYINSMKSLKKLVSLVIFQKVKCHLKKNNILIYWLLLWTIYDNFPSIKKNEQGYAMMKMWHYWHNNPYFLLTLCNHGKTLYSTCIYVYIYHEYSFKLFILYLEILKTKSLKQYS